MTSHPRALTWNLDEAPLRDLAAHIVTERVDEVIVLASDLLTVQTVQRLGYPVAPAAATAGSTTHACLLLPQLNLSLLPPKEYGYVVTHDQVRAFGEITGDMNPVHFDDEAARASGFEGRISHGMIFNGWLTRLLGTEFPGAGTIYLWSSCVYLAPVYPGRKYVVRVSVPRYDEQRGTYRIVAQLNQAGNGLAAVAYADVMKRPS